MQKRIKTLLKDNILLIAIFITLLIIYLSLMRMPKYGYAPKISGLDKILHSFAYFTLATSWLFTFYKKPKRKYIVVIACILFGIVIEVLQSTLTSYRTGEYLDIVANTSGVLLSLVVFNHVLKKNQVK